MYKITVHFISDVAGIYTKEEETADSKEHMLKKKCRMLDRWVKIIGGFDNPSSNDDIKLLNDDEKLELIQREVKMLNDDYQIDQPRQFIFFVEKYPF